MTNPNRYLRDIRITTGNWLMLMFLVALAAGPGCSERTGDPLYAAAMAAFIKDRDSHDPVQGELFDRLADGNFGAVESFIRSADDSFDSGKMSEYSYLHVYGALDTARDGLLDILDEWLSEFPDSHIAYYARGSFHAAEGLIARGGKYINQTPDSAIQAMNASFELASSDFRRALESQPGHVPSYLRLIQISRYAGAWDFHDAVYREAVTLYPESFHIHYAFAQSLLPKWRGTYKILREYAANISDRLELNPRLYALGGLEFSARGQTQYVRKNYPEAIDLFMKALDYAPLIAWYSGVARGYRKQGDGRSEIEYLDEVLKYEPTAAYSMARRATAYAVLGENEQAGADADKAMQLVRDLVPRGMTYRQCGWVYEKIGEYGKSAAAYEAAVDWEQDDAYSLRRAGRIYSTHLNDPERATRLLKRLVVLKPEDPRSWLYLGDALEDMDDYEARASLRKYLDLVDEKDESQKKIILQVREYLDSGVKP